MAASSSNGTRRPMSIIDDLGRYSSGCGYCNSRGRSVSHGLSASTLTVNDYQELLDRGWRRSGTHLYKPDGDSTCCPVYTIRLEADAFVPSKEQKRVMRRVQRYLDGHERQHIPGNASENGAVHSSPVKLLEDVPSRISTALKAVTTDWIGELQLGGHFDVPEVQVRQVSEKIKKQLKNLDTEAQYTSNAAFLLSAQLRKIRLPDGLTGTDLSPLSIAEVLATRLQDSKQLETGVSATACKGHVNFHTSDLKPSSKDIPLKRSRDDSGSDESDKPRKRLEIIMRKSSFDPEEFELYKRYQVAVHQDEPEDVQEGRYRRFLVDSPLIPIEEGSISYGSFHQQYRIDGKLVAVGIVDILPRCLSSKYLIWDPDFAFLSLGKFSVLKEIEWVQAAHRHNPLVQYYYLGYYIHTCPKMRYKAAYYPSELLCPVKFNWIPFDIARPLLSVGGAVCISDARDVPNEAEPFEESQDDQQRNEMQEVRPDENGYQVTEYAQEADSTDLQQLGEIPIMVNGRCWRFKFLEASDTFPPAILRLLKQRLCTYWKLVGTELASRIIYSL